MYQEEEAYGPVFLFEDPVYNHGNQFRVWETHHRRQLAEVNLLGKVFRSWLSRKGDAAVPVNPAVIADLKRTARLLHYCTSPLLIARCLATPTSAADKGWLETIKDELFSLYINYLISLGFQRVNERTSSKVKPARASSKPLYKCLQRSWPGGIIMLELSFSRDSFVVQLYTLEGSRLQQSSPLAADARGFFARECARYKDFIHVHSFMHDFHLRFLLELLSGLRSMPTHFCLRDYLQHCHAQSNPSPKFVHNLLKRGEFFDSAIQPFLIRYLVPIETLRVPTSVEPHLLYLHLLSHCKEFGSTTLELGAASSVTSDPSAGQLGLMIDVSGDSLGSTTSPELAKIMEENLVCTHCTQS